MTRLRFVGDLPLWVGLALALTVGLLSWRYYRREDFDLPYRLRWFLPLLRSLAFFLGVMVLTCPILEHRTVIGELGRVKIYLDASGSMTMRDQHMSPGRKLLVAEQLGWLPAGKVDATLLNAADEISEARREFVDRLTDRAGDSTRPTETSPQPAVRTQQTQFLSGKLDAAAVGEAQDRFLTRLRAALSQLPDYQDPTFEDASPASDDRRSLAARLNEKVIQPLTAVSAAESDNAPEDSTQQLLAVCSACEVVEESIRVEFEHTVEEIIRSGDESIRSALTLFDETPRWRRAELGLADSTVDVLTQLRREHDVDVLVLSGEAAIPQLTAARDSDSSGAETILSRTADEQTVLPAAFAGLTDLSSGIVSSQQGLARSRASEAVAQQPRAAVVLLTDGQHNSGPSPSQMARALGSQGVGIYCVSLGAPQAAPDLAVIGLEHPQLVFQKDRVRGIMIVNDRMPVGKPFVAQISYEQEVLWQQQLVTQASAERRIGFEFTIDELVERLGTQFSSDIRQHVLSLEFEASITPLPEESETSNNQRTMRLGAITQSYKVLIVDGRPRWETRYLRNVFERDEQWEVDTVIAGPGTDNTQLPRGEQADQFPTSRDALFEYDMVVYGEISADLFTDHEFDWLKAFVEIRGGGMIFIDGGRRRLLQLTEQNLTTLLPVDWVPDVVTAKPESLQLTEKGAVSSFLQLAEDDQQNRRFWTQLPPPHTLAIVEALPGSEVLVEARVSGRQQPVLVTRLFGRGVLYAASDETWRWRYKVADTYHQRFWNQVAKFVMPRPFAVSDEYVSVDTGPVSYAHGDSVDVRIRLLGLDGKPATGATVDAIVWRDGRSAATVSLHADADVPGIYRGRSGALEEGEYEVSVRAAGYSEAVLQARSRFVVHPPESGEMSQTAANEALLQEIATASGGRFLREEQIDRLPDLLSPLSSGRVVPSTTLLWQSYWWFAAIVILLTVEWLLRKRAGLL